MTEELVLHARSKLALEQFAGTPSHSLLLVGAKGAGKSTVARQLISQIIGKLDNNPYFLAVLPENNAISIETVRQLQNFVRLKTTGTAQWRRAILVENAQYMTIEAQNAFLKLLEEPPADTLIVLTVVNKTSLLPTITSRAPTIDVKGVSAQAATAHFKDFDSTAVNRAYHIRSNRLNDQVAR
jgi:DNA polymerase-3 subunit delta'